VERRIKEERGLERKEENKARNKMRKEEENEMMNERQREKRIVTKQEGAGKKGKGKVAPVLNWLSTMPCRCMGEWRCSSTILDLSTRWR
jgi:hypothetical protein